MMDIFEVGTGGGSIAQIADEGLRVDLKVRAHSPDPPATDRAAISRPLPTPTSISADFRRTGFLAAKCPWKWTRAPQSTTR